jgi:hypothetical protein
MKCECGSDEFYASQKVYQEILVDGDGNWLETFDTFDSSEPYDFSCYSCGKEYEELR